MQVIDDLPCFWKRNIQEDEETPVLTISLIADKYVGLINLTPRNYILLKI